MPQKSQRKARPVRKDDDGQDVETKREQIVAYRRVALQCLQNAEAAGDPRHKLRWALRGLEWQEEADRLETELTELGFTFTYIQ